MGGGIKIYTKSFKSLARSSFPSLWMRVRGIRAKGELARGRVGAREIPREWKRERERERERDRQRERERNRSWALNRKTSVTRAPYKQMNAESWVAPLERKPRRRGSKASFWWFSFCCSGSLLYLFLSFPIPPFLFFSRYFCRLWSSVRKRKREEER